ncbi:MFS transporter [Fulvivirgaceae bacterium BMA10]|uniref:MFS transporter n=1 Tax=Splendidivirga corallicola TaxID=3051826 RepID=A0ABT8KLY1_9BACT|nr:MFS transporter [Fulvivirgaceae bacterium BMA10]
MSDLNVVKRPRRILPIIIFSQFTGTSLWFATNAIITDIQNNLQLPESALGNVTSAVQFGFITGTLIFAFLAIADRFSPRKVFLWSSIIGAVANLSVYFLATDIYTLLVLRFVTGFFLAGIYPVGMKIAADWFEKGLGTALGFLVGALVFGTAFPHFIKGSIQSFSWENILFATSFLASLGGIILFIFVPDGPFRKPASKFNLLGLVDIFKHKALRLAAFGYFGHMWELYAFWAFVPVMISYFNVLNPADSLNISIWSFVIIAIGGFGCMIGGKISLHTGSRKVAGVSLFVSGLCCLISPFIFQLSSTFFLLILLIWGTFVVADSPQFSTLVAQTAPKESIGSALTIVNSIGFAITIVSIQIINQIKGNFDQSLLYVLLFIGPAFGLLSLIKLKKELLISKFH